MIPLLIAATPVSVPTGWHQVTTTRYLAYAEAALAGGDVLTTTAALLGIDADLLASVDVTSAALLFGPLSFMGEDMPAPPAWSYPAQVGNEAYLAVEEARTALLRHHKAASAEYPDPSTAWQVASLRALPDAFAILTQRHVARRFNDEATYSQAKARMTLECCALWPCSDVIPDGRLLLTNLLAFFEQHAAAFEAQEGDEDAELAEAAGVHRFARFGHLMPVSALCGNDPARFADIYQQPAHNVYLALAIRRESADYAAAYHRLAAERTTTS